MEKTIEAIKNLRRVLWERSMELESNIMGWEEETCGMDEETEEAQDLIHKTNLAYEELRLNDKLMEKLSLCGYCRMSDHNLCKLCG